MSKVKTFKTSMVREYSATPLVDDLGEANCKMTLTLHDDRHGSILWEISYINNPEEEDDEVGIGLWFNGMKVTGYDGVFSLPQQAVELLQENGYDTSDVED